MRNWKVQRMPLETPKDGHTSRIINEKHVTPELEQQLEALILMHQQLVGQTYIGGLPVVRRLIDALPEATRAFVEEAQMSTEERLATKRMFVMSMLVTRLVEKLCEEAGDVDLASAAEEIVRQSGPLLLHRMGPEGLPQGIRVVSVEAGEDPATAVRRMADQMAEGDTSSSRHTNTDIMQQIEGKLRGLFGGKKDGKEQVH